ncbi:MAG: hypothetical protein IPM57_07780 [Oligoflexia bacterium]|nr:hypothetical protein [Oligoflexia bacterium]
MVTGTQSLFEAIAMDIPFYYEQLVWKLELQEGLAERAKLSLNKEEAEFVKRLYSGVDSKEEPLKELFDSSEKQAIIKKFILSLKQAPSLSWSLEEVAKVLKP